MRVFFLILLLYLFTGLSAQHRNLSYIESSSGLGNPQWDGGMTELEFADINADGHNDIITIGDHGSPGINSSEHGIMVYFGDGAGNWTVQMTGDFGYGGIAAGDVNNDGHMDVGYGMHHDYSSTDLGDQLIEVALGDGTGTSWIPWDDGLATNGEDWGMFGTDFADIDNDGDLDLGSVSFGCCAGVHVYLNLMNGSWVQSFGLLNGNSTERFVFGDINNDSHTDFIVGHSFGAVYFGDGTGSFIPAGGNLPGVGSVGYFGPSLGDIDNDGDKDLAFITTTGLQVWGWDQDQGLWIDLSGNLPAGNNYEETQLYDMNADGHTDLAAYGNGTFTLWLGDGTGNWTQDAQFTTTGISDCKAFRVGGDVDHNGYPDIIMVAEGGSWPSYQNHLKCYRESSVPQNLSVHPILPHGHEVFRQGSVQFLDWLSAVPAGTATQARLQFSATGLSGTWLNIADSIPNNGRFQWTVPMVFSDSCYIKYTIFSTSSEVSALTGPFSVTGENILQAEFSGDPTLGAAPLQVSFTDLSTGMITEWEWDFDHDGTIDSQEQNPVWVYDDPGIYSVWLRISDGSQADTMDKMDYILVAPQAVAAFTADPQSGTVPLEVQFTDLSTGGIIGWWAWDFENDGITDSWEQHPIHTYTEPGLYSVKLTVTNGVSTDSIIKTGYINALLSLTEERSASGRLSIYPNPFGEKVRINLETDRPGPFTCHIYDILGSSIAIPTAVVNTGTYQWDWDGSRQEGGRVHPGIYHLVITGREGFRMIRKLIFTGF
ncbi:MAG: VCBS repeat-containing protein [Bacteroidales bacterium]|nr:VCBS repeat-containing protein [Bacteroidales bacterium]